MFTKWEHFELKPGIIDEVLRICRDRRFLPDSSDESDGVYSRERRGDLNFIHSQMQEALKSE